MRVPGTLALVAALGAVPSWAGPVGGFALVAQTPRFSFFSRAGHPVPAERSEKFLADVEQKLGTEFKGRAEYFLYAWPEEVQAATGVRASGVTLSAARQIHSTEPFHAHEIVHLVAAQLGDPGPLFQEGLAVALGDGGRWRGRPLEKAARDARRRVTLDRLLGAFRELEPEVAYPLAGSFVRHLVETHGQAKVADYFRACRSASVNPGAAFARVFGQPLDGAAAEWWQRLA